MSKVLAVNGSPRMEKGNTAVLLTAFCEGMQEAGGEVEIVYPSAMKLRPCACSQMYCWYTKPGECCVKDEMQAVYPGLKAADVLVVATPVYIPLPCAMQIFLNRMCPLLEPLLEIQEGRTRGRFRDGVSIQQLVLVSTGGWWEKENFDVVEHIVKELAQNADAEFAGSLLRPHAFLMKKDGQLTGEGKAVLEAARRAGRELIADGEMGALTLECVSRPLISHEGLTQLYNQWIEDLQG